MDGTQFTYVSAHWIKSHDIKNDNYKIYKQKYKGIIDWLLKVYSIFIKPDFISLT